MRNFGKNNTAIIHQAVDKMNKGNLEVSDILDSEELITDVKSSMSQLAQYFSSPNNIKNLIDFVIKEPSEDDHKRGHKFPFNACEILCSDNPVIVSKLFDEHKIEDDYEEDDDKKKNYKKSEDEHFEIEIDVKAHEESPNEVKEIEVSEEKYVVENINEVNFKKNEAEIEYKDDEDIVNIAEKIVSAEKTEQEESPFEKKSELEINEVAKDFSERLNLESKEELKSKVQQICAEVDSEPYEEEIPELIVGEEGKADEIKTDQKEDRKETLNVSYDNKLDTDLLDYFFGFLESTNDLNFVLSGYFAKIFGHFLNLRQPVLMRYLLLQRPQHLNSLTKHLNRKSIMECIYKIIISYAEDIQNSLDIKINFLKSVLNAFDPEDIDVVCNISEFLVELFSVRKMYFTFITNQEVFQLIHNFVISNIHNSSFIYLIRILQKANENILKDFGQSTVTPVFTCYETQEMFFNFTHNVNNLVSGNTAYNSQADTHDDPTSNVNNLHQQFNNIFLTLISSTQAVIQNFIEESSREDEIMDTTYGLSTRKLGLRRLHEIEYIRSILEIFVNACGNSTLVGNLDLSLIVSKISETDFFRVATVSELFDN